MVLRQRAKQAALVENGVLLVESDDGLHDARNRAARNESRSH